MYHLVAHCPKCSRELSVRHNRSTGEPFIGCDGYRLGCKFTEPYDEVLAEFADEIAALHRRASTLEHELERLNSSHSGPLPNTIDRELRDIAVLSHPDRWPDNELAHQVCAAVNNLRTRFSEGR
jgi:hypothetical protein